MTNKNLYIPAKLKNKVDLLPGFGMKELIPVSVIALCSCAVGFITALITGGGKIHPLPPVIGLLAGAAAGYGLYVKSNINLSIMDFIKQALSFINSKKYYPYRKLDNWRNY